MTLSKQPPVLRWKCKLPGFRGLMGIPVFSSWGMKSSNLSSFFVFLDTVDSWPKFDRLVVLNSVSSLKGVLSGIAAVKLAMDYLDCLRLGLTLLPGVLSVIGIVPPNILLMFLLINVGSIGGRVS